MRVSPWVRPRVVNFKLGDSTAFFDVLPCAGDVAAAESAADAALAAAGAVGEWIARTCLHMSRCISLITI